MFAVMKKARPVIPAGLSLDAFSRAVSGLLAPAQCCQPTKAGQQKPRTCGQRDHIAAAGCLAASGNLLKFRSCELGQESTCIVAKSAQVEKSLIVARIA